MQERTSSSKILENIIPPNIQPDFFWSEDYTTDLDKVEVKGSVVLSAIEAFPNHSNIIVDLLKGRGIEFIFPDNWYPWKDWLSCLNEIKTRFSKTILFEMGKKIIETADFPPQVQTIQNVLSGTNVAYHMNLRSGRIGYYRLEEFNEDRKYAVMKCHNPNPSDYDKGIIQGMANKFRPQSSFMVNVILMKMEEPSREEGGKSDYFKIKW